jgi:hypothetical protein
MRELVSHLAQSDLDQLKAKDYHLSQQLERAEELLTPLWEA